MSDGLLRPGGMTLHARDQGPACSRASGRIGLPCLRLLSNWIDGGCNHSGLSDRNEPPLSVGLQNSAGAAIDELFVEHACLLEQILVSLVSEDLQRVEKLHSSVAAERQPQASSQRLLRQNVGDRCAERCDDVDILDVPALLEHAHRDDDAVTVAWLL